LQVSFLCHGSFFSCLIIFSIFLENKTVWDLKKELSSFTAVDPKKQKLIGLKHNSGKAACDNVSTYELSKWWWPFKPLLQHY